MSLRTGRQYKLPYGSSLALLGACALPAHPAYSSDDEGLAFAAEVNVAMSTPADVRAKYLQYVVQSILALVRHHNDSFSYFDPTLLVTDPVTDEHTWKRVMFRVNRHSMRGDTDSYCRMLAKRLSRAWHITDWLVEMEGKDGRGKANDVCTVRPIDAVVQVLDGRIATLVPEELRYPVRHWCACAVEARDRWCFYPLIRPSRLHDDARQWLVDQHFLVPEASDRNFFWFTEKFVYQCWKDAMENLS